MQQVKCVSALLMRTFFCVCHERLYVNVLNTFISDVKRFRIFDYGKGP